MIDTLIALVEDAFGDDFSIIKGTPESYCTTTPALYIHQVKYEEIRDVDNVIAWQDWHIQIDILHDDPVLIGDQIRTVFEDQPWMVFDEKMYPEILRGEQIWRITE